MPIKLFISHSSKTEQNLQLLRSLCEHLEKPQTGYKLIYDRNGEILAGSDWYDKIDRWMAQCHAAVILFSKAALFESDWIKKEATILAWRDKLQKEFVLIPVLLDGLKPEELKSGLFGILKIQTRQCVELETASNVKGIAEEILKALSKHSDLQQCQALSPGDKPTYDPLERPLMDLLCDSAKADDLEEITDDLELQLPSWPPDPYKQCALAITRYLLESPTDTLNRLLDVLGSFKKTPPEREVDDIFRYLRSLWVNPIAAGGIPASRISNRMVALNGLKVNEYTAERYGERAWPFARRWELVKVNSTSFTGIKNDIEEHFSAGRNLPKKERRDRVNTQKVPVVVVLPPLSLEPTQQPQRLVTRLRKLFPKVIFLINTGQISPEWIPDDVSLLEPPLEAQTETAQSQYYDDTQRFFCKLYSDRRNLRESKNV